MSASDILPDPDLLQKIDGIESSLRKGKKLGVIGWAGLAATAAPLIVNGADAVRAVSNNSSDLLEQWPLLLALGLAVVFFVIVLRTRFLLKESREPFRYTYSIGAFEGVDDEAPPVREIRSWLPHDISERLNDRIKRLSPLDESNVTDRLPDSHIRVSGEYVVRTGDAVDVLEILPRIHIGPIGKDADTLAHRIRFELPHVETSPVAAPVRTPSAAPPPTATPDSGEPVPATVEGTAEEETETTFEGADEEGSDYEEEGDPFEEEIDEEEYGGFIDEGLGGGRPPMDTDDYRLVLERVYFSVATEIYRQIRRDVQKRINLLPGKRFKAAAYLYEADDYATSNTLDAYDAAQQLYRSAMQIYVPRPSPLAPGIFKRSIQLTGRGIRAAYGWVRRLAAKVVPGISRREVMTARAAMGYANMLVYRRIMAGLSGREIEAIFRARPAAEDAVARLRAVPSRYPKRDELLFQALVTLALVQSRAGPLRRSQATLKEARALSPALAEKDPRYLFATAITEPSIPASIPPLRRAVAVDPRSEVTGYALALRMEMLWRRRQTLEAPEAEIVREQYEKVIDLNPGNIQAWAHIGYMHWLMGDLDAAQDHFRRGRDYRDVKPDTFVALLDYGAARIEAERGDLSLAYRLYMAARVAQISQGMSHDPENTALYYFFSPATEPVVKRFTEFRSKVSARCRASNGELPRRVRDALLSCVTSEFGEASQNAFFRTGDDSMLEKAKDAYERAVKLDPTNVLADYNLCTVKLRESELATEEGHRLSALAERRLARPAGAAPDRDQALLARERAEELLKRSDDLVKEAVTLAERIKAVEPAWVAAKLLLITANARLAALSKRAIPRYEQLAQEARSKTASLQADAASPEGSLETRTRAVYGTGMQRAQAASAVELTVKVAEPKRLERDIKRSTEIAERYESQATHLKRTSVTAIAEVWRQLHDLLPHGWLWVETGGALDWNSIHTRDRALMERWSEELDDLHAKALVTWARANVLLEKGDGGVEPHLAELLLHMYRHLLPDDMDLLLAYRDADQPSGVRRVRLRARPSPADESLDVDDAIKYLISWRYKTEPDSYWMITQLGDRAFTDEERVGFLESMRATSTSPAMQKHVLRHLSEAQREMGLRLWQAGSYTDAAAMFRSMDIDHDGTASWWRSDLVDDLLAEPGSDEAPAEAFDQLRSWLEDSAARAQSAAVRVDSTNAALSVVRRKYHSLRRGIAVRMDEPELAPLATPFALEVGRAVFPGQAEDADLLRLTKEELPAMVVGLSSELGIEVPAVTVRIRDDLDERAHQILVKEVVVETARTPAGAWFCGDKAGSKRLDLPTVDESERPPGVWLDDAARRRAKEAHLDVTDLVGFFRRHVEHAARSHAPAFVDFQWVQDRLRAWASGDRRRIRWLGDEFARPQNRAIVTRSMQMLCEQGVSLVDLTSIVDEMGAALRELPREPDVHDAAEKVTQAVRRGMKDLLPGNHPGSQRVRMPARAERAIARHTVSAGGTRYLALPAAEIETLVQQIRTALHEAEDPIIVVRDSEQWVLAERFLSEHMPGLRSMAEDEIVVDLSETARSTSLAGVTL